MCNREEEPHGGAGGGLRWDRGTALPAEAPRGPHTVLVPSCSPAVLLGDTCVPATWWHQVSLGKAPGVDLRAPGRPAAGAHAPCPCRMDPSLGPVWEQRRGGCSFPRLWGRKLLPGQLFHGVIPWEQPLGPWEVWGPLLGSAGPRSHFVTLLFVVPTSLLPSTLTPGWVSAQLWLCWAPLGRSPAHQQGGSRNKEL